MNTFQYLTPAQVGINAVDMEAAGATNYTSNVLDGRGAFAFQAIVDIDSAGSPSAGLATLSLLLYDNDGSTLLATIPMVTSINTQTNGNQCILVFGGGVTASVAAGSGMTGTIAPDADKIKVIGKYALRLTVATQGSGGTSQTASVTLMAEKS